MLIYREPKSGRTQEVQERETVKRKVLERLGWSLWVEDSLARPPVPERVDLDHYDMLNVRDAIAYLDSLKLDADEGDDMAKYESRGKERATVLKWLES